MRVTLDSSVLIAAYVARGGTCAELLEDIMRHHQLVLSSYILDEVRRKLTYEFLFPPTLTNQVLQALTNTADLVEPAPLPADACRDPAAIPVIGTAVAGDAEFLITVDNDLFDLKRYHTVEIIRPGEFWNRVPH